MRPATVHLVHCIDTEGPLHEAVDVKFARLKDRFGIDLAPRRDTLRQLKAGEIDLGGKEAEVAAFLNSHNQTFLGSWPEVEAMLDRVMSREFRCRITDSRGGGWVYNWFCLDMVNVTYNPRGRDVGYHNVLDRYRQIVSEAGQGVDAIHWHFHPVAAFRDAHHCATHYLRSPEIFQILARKVIERSFFPACYRAGFQTERPDSHWFLEQWIPFDFSNMAVDDPTEFDRQIDFRNGRSGDWRRAPADWSVYHPSHDDYQQPGQCRRWIARCLNIFNRIAVIDQNEMDKAFARAALGLPTLVAVANHDFRDLGPEVDFVRGLAVDAARRHPGVTFQFSEALEAFRAVACPEAADAAALDFDLNFHPATAEDVPFIEVALRAGQVFGPQPFLAIETRGREFQHDNFDFSPCGRRWFYAFHGDTLPLETVARIGVAANDKFGNTCIKHLDLTR